MSVLTLGARIFKKSSFSPFTRMIDPRCVAVSISDKDVLVASTQEPDKVLCFSHDEWDAFVKGVKSGEFDI